MSPRDRSEIASALSMALQQQPTPSAASLRGISSLDGGVVWASGSGGTVLRHRDLVWREVSVPGTEDLDFRSIHALDADTAVVLSAGSPARLYRTEDGGRSWRLVYEDTRPQIFFDAMRFADARFGLAFSDPIDGHLELISTTDSGRSWMRHSGEASPATIAGEAGFAASNSGLIVSGQTACIGLGGETSADTARVALSGDRGRTWEVVSTPMRCSPSSGIFSLAMDGGRRGVAVGGDYLRPESTSDNVVISRDGGRTWIKPKGKPPGGYRSAVAFLPALGEGVVLAVGPTGADVSSDYGQSWTPVDLGAWHAMSVSPSGTELWLSGAEGRVGHIRLAGRSSFLSGGF